MTITADWLSAVDRDPDGYFDANVDCLWTFLAPKDYVVDVMVLYVYMHLKTDPDLYEDPDEMPRQRKIFCGDDTFPVSFTSEFNQLFVRFYSIVNGPGPGFSLTSTDIRMTLDDKRRQKCLQTCLL